MSAKPVKISFLADTSDLASGLSKAGAGLDDFGREAADAGTKAESALAGVGDKADALGGASSQAAGGLGDLGGALSLMPGPLGALGTGMEAAAPAIMGVTGAADLLNLATTKFPALAKAQTVATNVLAGAQKALNLVMAGNPIALVVLAIVALIAIFATLYAKNEAFRELVNKVFGALKQGVEVAVDKLGGFLGTVKDKLGGAGDKFQAFKDAAANAIGSYSADGGGVLGKVHDIVSAVTGLPGTIADKAAGLFGPVRDAAANAIGSYSDNGGGALGKLHDIVSAIGGMGATIRDKAAGMWDGLSGSFKGAINLMIGWWNNLSFHIDIPDKIPGLPDSFTISTPDIPMLANGGIVTRPTLAIIGEAGPEAVIPLNGRYGTGGNTYSVTLNVPPTANPVEVGREVQRVLNAFRRAGGGV
jgi:hypothetical protein